MNPRDEQPYQYTRGDLQRYLTGKMSPAEMHRLEKAAMEDPFLSEALEGMLDFSGTDLSKDLEQLTEKVGDRVSARETSPGFTERPGKGPEADPSASTETNPLPAPGSSHRQSFPMFRKRWFRMAAAALFLLGFATITLYLLNNDKPQTIASLDQRESTVKKDSIQQSGIAEAEAQVDSVQRGLHPVAPAPSALLNRPAGENASEAHQETAAPEKNIAAAADRTKDSLSRNAETFAVKSEPAPIRRETAAAPKAATTLPAQVSRPQQDITEPAYKARARNVQGGIPEKTAGPYVYTGQILDPAGKPVSFVNLRIHNSAAGTYSDARGNYRIVSGDSSLQVDLKAYGFQGRSMVLGASRPRQDFRLEPSTVGLESKSTRSKASAKEEMTKMDEDSTHEAEIPEAEPSDGWGAYQFYLLNNLRIPTEAQRQNLHGTVDISFLVAENGRLSDFRVEKSLTPSCDKEAIRLVREGPAWTLYNSEKPLRARVTVVF